MNGPQTENAKHIYRTKYLSSNETFKDGMSRIASALSQKAGTPKAPGTYQDFQRFRQVLLDQKFLPAGRVQAAVGSPRKTTPYNCFVSGDIQDSMQGIMEKNTEAALTMKLGGGIGYDFSTIRPSGDNIVTLESAATGPLSFMNVFDATCGTVSSSGHRRGAQMAVLRVDHPDIEAYVHAKNNDSRYTNFNTSIGVTDEFMKAVRAGKPFDLRFDGKVYKTVDARNLWDAIMRSTWDWAEPGVLFIDRINNENNLKYCETISATNPCGEQPLPPYGACLLGSLNLTKFLSTPGVHRVHGGSGGEGGPGVLGVPDRLRDQSFDYQGLSETTGLAVRMLDAVIDDALYPLPQQEKEAKDKRRMGIGITGLANAGEALGYPYGSEEFVKWMRKVMRTVRDSAYRESILLAKEKGPFPLFNAEEYLKSPFIKKLPKDIQDDIGAYGIRNSHLLSVAPTGTISMAADNVSSGLEPVFAHEYTATINYPTGVEEVTLKDYAWENWGLKGVTANELSAEDHVKVLCVASEYVDSACSKTCNVGPEVSFEDFKGIYQYAYDHGAKGCTTFRANGKRFGVRNVEEDVPEGTACYFNEQGIKECS